ncbi:RNA polymerase sigma factor [Calycomorphotria hydatis]|uniref:RNA polymerase sigma factor n=1 Tax=Calycomorphotria hydatis TaxID=2528027 RepID=UPI0018D26B43|nr:sigma-70 family RNA polymerase sigma factor [Calycomorphotria hydatis]
MSIDSGTISDLEHWLDRLRQHDPAAREELIRRTMHRVERLTRKIKADFPRVGRWEQTEDVSQIALLKLYEALEATPIESPLHYFRLAAQKIRQTLIDFTRQYQGPRGLDRHHHSHLGEIGNNSVSNTLGEQGGVTYDPARLSQWSEMHHIIDNLSAESREMFDLIYYHDLSRDDAAELLELSERQVKRRWRHAKEELASKFDATEILS